MSTGNENTAAGSRAARPGARTDEREIVLNILLDREFHGGFSSTLIRNAQDRHAELSPAQRSFIKRLSEGTIEREIELDAVIRRHQKSPDIPLKTSVRCILRMSLYQIYYMDRVPDFAVCSEAVRLCRKRHLTSQTGFVNGLLRTVCREKERQISSSAPAGSDRLAPAGSDGSAPAGSDRPAAAGDCSERYSMPSVIVDLWEDQLGPEHTESLCRSMLGIRPVCIRLNPALTHGEKEETLQELRTAGLEPVPGRWARDCYYLHHAGEGGEASAQDRNSSRSGASGVAALPGFREGRWIVQDESSQLVAAACGLYGASSGISQENAGPSGLFSAGAVIADVCAAPGGKTILLAQLLPEAQVYSFDLTEAKTRLIRGNLVRMKVHNVTVAPNDAANPGPSMEALKGRADLVLCDVPCSGLGVMTKKRDIKYNFSLRKVHSLVNLQKRVVRNAAALVKPGGILIYSTCTINRMENEKMADYIAANTPLVPDPLEPYLPENFPGIEGGRVQMFPDVHGTDGFFLARFRSEQNREQQTAE